MGREISDAETFIKGIKQLVDFSLCRGTVYSDDSRLQANPNYMVNLQTMIIACMDAIDEDKVSDQIKAEAWIMLAEGGNGNLGD